MLRERLSKLTYESIQSEGLNSFNMPVDTSDALRSVRSKEAFERAKKELMDSWGDAEMEIDKNQPWYDQVKVVDKAFIEDHEKFCERKAAWCAKYGCD